MSEPELQSQIKARLGSTASAEEIELGARIRDLRKERDWTLGETSSRTGLARSTISKIENNQMSPTFDVLQKLAAGFEIDITQLFVNRVETAPIGRRSITRKGEGQRYQGDRFHHEMLCADIANKRLLPHITRLSAHDISEYDDWHRHEGEDFMYVLEGKVRVYTEFYEPADLNEGDSLYFDSRMGHLCVSNSEEDALILWVCTNNA